MAAQPGQPTVDAHQNVVGNVTKYGDPTVVTRHLIELVAVDDEIALSVCGSMNVFADDLNVAECHSSILAQGLVVITWNKEHTFAVAGPAQYLLNDCILIGGPMYAAVHRPEVDDIANEEEILAFVFTKE